MTKNKNNLDNSSGLLCEFTHSKKLLVTFGGVNQGVGMPIFEFNKTISHLNCDKILVRDLGQTWYQNGIDDNILSLLDLKDYLKKLIESNKYEQIVFMGNSMGGFAAILFGSMLNVSKVIAFAPQTFIGRYERLISLDFRWKKQMKKIHKNKDLDSTTFDLKNILNFSKSNTTKIDVYYSRTHRLDRLHAVRLQKYNSITLHGFDEGGHTLVKTLRDNKKLTEIINNIFI